MCRTLINFMYKARKFLGEILNKFSTFDHITSSCKSLVINQPEIVFTAQDKVAVYVTYPSLFSNESEMNLFNALKSHDFKLVVIQCSQHGRGTIESDVILRQNGGFDLGAIRDFFYSVKGDAPKRFMILNSSVTWNNSTSEFFSKVEFDLVHKSANVIAATESYQHVRHAQSFFFYMDQFGFGEFREIYLTHRNWRSKRAAVRFGEIPILKRLEASGVKVHFMFPYEALASKISDASIKFLFAKIPLNPSVDLYRVLTRLGAPFTKKRLNSRFDIN